MPLISFVCFRHTGLLTFLQALFFAFALLSARNYLLPDSFISVKSPSIKACPDHCTEKCNLFQFKDPKEEVYLACSRINLEALWLPTKVHLVKVTVFPVVMYGCENWTKRKKES